MWCVALQTPLPMSPGRNPAAGHGAGRAPTEVNWMLMGSLQDRLCCTALSCFTWLLSPACITSSMWKVPGSLESHMMTMDKSGSLAERKIPSTITEQGEKRPDRLTLLRANLWASLTGSLHVRPPVALLQQTCVVQLRGHKAGHGCEVRAKTPHVPNSPFALYSPWTGFFYLRTWLL